MSVSRKRPSRAQEREYVNCLRTLQAEGICVDIPDDWVERSCALDIHIAPPPISTVFDWPSGSGAGYAVWLRLLSRQRCMLEECALTVSWDERIIVQTVDERKPCCEFGPRVFPLKKVLNHRIENTLRFPHAGVLVEGMILARGVSRIPEEYTSGLSVPFTLTLYDQYGEEIVEQGHLSVGERARKPMKTMERPAEDLFGKPRSNFTGRVAESGKRLAHRSQPKPIHLVPERDNMIRRVESRSSY